MKNYNNLTIYAKSLISKAIIVCKNYIMRGLIIACLLAGCCNYIQAQKRAISNETHKTWKTLRRYAISDDGKYVWYEYGAESARGYLVICTTDGKFKREFAGARNAVFSG